jgi:hypothetical protein
MKTVGEFRAGIDNRHTFDASESASFTTIISEASFFDQCRVEPSINVMVLRTRATRFCVYGVGCAFHPRNRIDIQVLDNLPDRKATKGEVDVPEAALKLRSIEFRVVQK